MLTDRWISTRMVLGLLVVMQSCADGPYLR